MQNKVRRIILPIIFWISLWEIFALMIGNSFSICVGKYLPQIVNAGNNHSINLTSAYIGGCSIKKHAKILKKAETNPDFKPYLISIWDSKSLDKKVEFKGNVNQLLKENQYDIISIQQASHESFDYQTYQPFIQEVIDYIKKHNPKAEIVIQQTWAYRSDSERLKNWKLSQNEMKQKVCEAYQLLAKETGFRIIPVGEAVNLARQNKIYQFTPPTKEELEKFTYPNLPSSENDIVGKYFYSTKDDKKVLNTDSPHLNFKGEFLQACVWYGTLFNENPDEIKFKPKKLSETEAIILKKAAAEAVYKYNK